MLLLFKGHKRSIEKELAACINKLTAVKRSNKPELAADALQAHTLRLMNLKQKYAKLLQEESDMSANVLTRLQNQDLTSLQVSLLDYMLRRGYFKTARDYAAMLSLEELSDIAFFEQVSWICDDISQNEFQSALDFCKQNRAKLEKR